MNLRRILLTICLMLAGAALAPWLYRPSGPGKQQAGSPPLPFASHDFNDPGPLETYSGIVERPVFLASRRPGITPENSQRQPGEVLLLDRYPVVGVVVAGERRIVLIRQGPDDTLTRIEQGAVLDGWTLSKVTRDLLVLEMADARKEVSLRKNGGEAD